MEKKQYYISITGESAADTTRYLSEQEYNLIKGIFDEVGSEYISAYIGEIPDIDMLAEKYKDADANTLTLLLQNDDKYDFEIAYYIAGQIYSKRLEEFIKNH